MGEDGLVFHGGSALFLFSLPSNTYASLLQHAPLVGEGLGGGVVWVGDPVTSPRKHGN